MVRNPVSSGPGDVWIPLPRLPAPHFPLRRRTSTLTFAFSSFCAYKRVPNETAGGKFRLAHQPRRQGFSYDRVPRESSSTLVSAVIVAECTAFRLIPRFWELPSSAGVGIRLLLIRKFPWRVVMCLGHQSEDHLSPKWGFPRQLPTCNAFVEARDIRESEASSAESACTAAPLEHTHLQLV